MHTALYLITMALTLLSACDQVPIKDEIWYGSKGMGGAIQVHTLTPDTKTLSFEEWMQTIRTKPLACTSLETVGDIKASIEKLCSICGCCSYDTQKAVEAFFGKIESVKP